MEAKHTLTAFILMFIVLTIPGNAQSLHTSSNRAVKAYNEASAYFDYLDYQKAETLLKSAVTYDPGFIEAYLMLGEISSKLNNFKQAVEYYTRAVQIDSSFYLPVFFSLANAEFITGDYGNALIHYEKYLDYKSGSEKNRALAARNVKNCEFAIKAVDNPVPFNPVSIGEMINTRDDEYWPSITVDGQTLMFTRQLNTGNFRDNMSLKHEDFYLSFLSEKGWEKAVNAGAPLNTRSNEGAQTISSNGNFMYFTACDRPDGLGSCDIYFSAFRNGQWTQPFNLGSPVNTSSWESTPSVSADGNLLIFSSSRQGGLGGKDLWFSRINGNGKWSVPVNMGNILNTEGDEMSPFIHFDGRTLYFASDGRPGMGGFDIYLTRLSEDSTWSEPQNLGYPINTSSDDMGLIIDGTGQKAYFSSKRDNDNGKDIFFFTLDESIRPEPVSYLKGKVTDKETGQMLKADYELINLSTNKVTVKSSTDEFGNFLVCLPSGFNYGINVTKPGYLFYSENFMFEGQHSAIEPFIKSIILSPARVGERILLTNVFYEFDSWELKKESMEELNNLYDILIFNKNIIIEIGGYTDSTGSDEYNIALSQKRALSVVNYLVNKGISTDRLIPKGYGNNFPKGDNITSEGRKLNRRTEAIIVGAK